MTVEEFNQFLDHVIEKHIKATMRRKSAEYASGTDKLHNFKKASKMSALNLEPEHCLYLMRLKHEVSISDMLEQLDEDYSQELWEEKLTDSINYTFLLWALLAERNEWKIDQ